MERIEINNLITQAGLGNEQAMEQLYNGIGKAVYSFIFSYLKDSHLTEDIMQETFLRLFTKPKVMNENDNGLAYIMTIARNLSINLMKRERKQIATESETIEIFSGVALGAGERKAEIKEFIATLTEEEKKVLILKEIHGLTYEEIRKVMKLSIATVKRRMESVREKSIKFDKD